MHNALNLLSSVCSPLFVIILYTEMRENKTLLLAFLCTYPLSSFKLTYARPLNIIIFNVLQCPPVHVAQMVFFSA